MQLVSDPKAQNASIKKEIMMAIEEVVDSGWYILGSKVEQFEQEFAKYCGVKYCIGVRNGTDAITLALLALGIGSGDEVICPSLTATFTALAISAAGAEPVFADVSESTLTIDPEDIEKRITKKTKAIVPVHLYGHPADMDPILKIAKKHKLFVIEDACQAHGAKYKGKTAGSIGEMGCFSFYPTKNLGGVGDGGAVTTNDVKISETLKMLRNGGQANRYEHVILGRNSRLDELQAAVLLVKLKYLKEWNRLRSQIAKNYRKQLSSLDIILPEEVEWADPVHHLFVIRVKNRTELAEKLKQLEIQTQVHYPIPAHLQPIYTYSSSSLPTTERICQEILSLPIYPELSEKEAAGIAQSISRICRQVE